MRQATLLAFLAVLSGFATDAVAANGVETPEQSAPLLKYRVPVDFHFLVGKSSSGKEKVAGSEHWAECQLHGLNRAYDGLVEFELGDATELRGELAEQFYRDADSWEAVQTLSEAYGRPDRINVFVAKNFSDGGFGHANQIFAPLSGETPPSLVVRTGILSTFGVLMAHEVGHLLGLEHTASRACYGDVKVFEGCGKRIEYPCFEFESFWDFSRPDDVEGFAYSDWHGRRNIMAHPSWENFLRLDLPEIDDGAYGASFREIIACWAEQSGIRGE